MKKYLAALIPFFVCTILSFVYGTKQPKNYPDPSYPYQTKATLTYLSTNWFYIGIIISAIFVCILLIDDMFEWFGKWVAKRRFEHHK